MTVVEKAAYLKGLVEGLGIEADSKEGKLWGALNDLLHDMAHEIEDLQASNMDHAEALDEIEKERDGGSSSSFSQETNEKSARISTVAIKKAIIRFIKEFLPTLNFIILF